MKNPVLIVIGALVVLGAAYFLFTNTFDLEEESETGKKYLGSSQNAKITDDYEGAKIEPEDLERGCPRRDCIPSIDEPEFETVTAADEWLNDGDRVFGIVYKGVERAYAQRILNWHEIVNDEIAGEPIGMTFCPLCGTAVSFLRYVDGNVSEFGVSGFLHNNDLVMYDRIEGNLWQQVTAEAIVGPAARRNEELELLNTITTTWDVWKVEHPDSEILAIPKGFLRDYDRYPYGTYEEDGSIYFGLENSDNRLHPKAIVYGIIINGEAKGYSEERVVKEGTINDVLGGVTISLVAKSDGDITFTDLDTGEELVPLRGFWFSWAAFNPSTLLYN